MYYAVLCVWSFALGQFLQYSDGILTKSENLTNGIVNYLNEIVITQL